MKIVAAKCPSCGSNLKVDENRESTICEYCKSTIIVDRAVNKYKLESSGDFTIENLPKIESYLRIAERSFNSEGYEEAYRLYKEVLTIDPTNSLALLRYAICKSLLNNYIDYKLDYLNKTIKEVINSIKEDENKEVLEGYIKESCNAIDKSFAEVRKYINYNIVNASELMEIQSKLISIVTCYETLLEYTVDNKKYIIQKIVPVLDVLIKDKDYKTGTAIDGGIFTDTYKLSPIEKNILNNKLNYYNNILFPNSQYENDKNNIGSENFNSNTNNRKLLKKITLVIFDAFLLVLILGSALSNQYLSSLILIFILVIISFNKISKILFNGDKNKKRYSLVVLMIILFIAIINRI